MAQDRRSSLKWLFSQWRTWILLILVTAAVLPWVPGPSWAYLVLAGVLSLGFVAMDHEMVRVVLSLLASVFPPVDWALSYERRQRALGEIAGRMDRMLKYFELERSLSPQDLDEFSARPPHDTKEDLLAACCSHFAEKVGSHPEVLELLYRDFYDQATAVPKDEHKRELARILVYSHRLPGIEEIRPEDRMELVLRVLDCLLGPFKLKLVQDEMRSWSRLWNHLTGYAGYLSLSAESVPAAPDMKALRHAVDSEIPGGLLEHNYDKVAEKVLLRMSCEWIRDWAKAASVPEPDAANLAVVEFGIFSSEHEAAGKPLLAALGCRVASNQDAFDMLLAHLWTESQPATAGRGLQALAPSWKTWRDDARWDMGPGITAVVENELTSRLKKGEWPSQMPVEHAVAEISREIEQSRTELVKLRKGQKKTHDWLKKSDELYKWASGYGLPNAKASLAEIKKTVNDAVQDKLRQLTPPAPVSRKSRGLKRELDTFARRFLPETPTVGHPIDGAPPISALAAMRDRAVELGHELEEISDMLLAEAGGARAYLITFDQSRGGLAELIDELAEDYGFEHYTRYSRIGVLCKGEAFETFYRRFVAALEEKFAEKFENAAPDDWQQIEITVQPIVLSHRHEFVAEAEKDLKGNLPAGTVLTKVFRMPSPRTLLQPAA